MVEENTEEEEEFPPFACGGGGGVDIPSFSCFFRKLCDLECQGSRGPTPETRIHNMSSSAEEEEDSAEGDADCVSEGLTEDYAGSDAEGGGAGCGTTGRTTAYSPCGRTFNS